MSALFFIFDAVKTNWVYKFVKYLKKVYFRNDKRVVAFLICVGIATGFWFLNALSKTYTVDIVAPVKYTNLPNNKTLSTQLPEKFDLRIKAHGFTIIRHQLSFLFMPMEFNVNNLTSNRMIERRRNSFAFPTRLFLSDLAYQLSNELEILNMTPDTLFFKFDQTGQKRVKVKPIVSVNLKKQFQISGEITASPDSVQVNGPQSVLDTLHFILTESQKFNAVDQSVQTEASLQNIKETFFEPLEVAINIPVEEYTEAQLSIPVMLNDSPSDMTIKLFPSKVKVTFQVGLSRFQNMQPEDFKLSVSFSEIKEGKQRLKISQESTPAYLYDIKITPEEIEYLIEN
ncbi:MAG TPA: hypothetical protein DHV48_12615 [Prolixibacteraceae bacterium]|nr:hypothetical protein [Prolixibacteraceae bacterium]